MLALALAVRTLYLLSIRHAYFFEHLVTEPQRYDGWAMDIVRGVAPARPPFDEAPAYPYFVAAIYGLAGHSRFAVTAVQAILDAASCSAVAAIAMRVAPDRARIGWIAGVLAALFGPTIYFTGQLEPATLAIFAVTMAMLATPLDRATTRAWALAGAAWAAAILVRSEILLGVPVLLVHAWLVAGRAMAARAAIAPAAVLALSLAVNVASSGHPVLLTTGSGVNLWIGNHELADGTNPFVEGPLAETAREVESQTDDAVVADALFRDRALAAMRRSPGRAAGLFLRKLVWLFTDRELPNAMDIEWQERRSSVFALRVLPLRFGLVFALACAGVAASWSRRRSLVVLFAPLAIAAFVSVVFFTNARFRVVLAPSLVLFAAVAIDALPRLRGRALAPPALALALGAILTFGDWYGVREHRLAAIDDNTRALEVAENRSR